MTPISQTTLIIGGARSGKSSLAERLAARAGRPVIYVATARILDEEMALRIQKHKEQRPSDWRLIEEPLDIGAVLQQLRDEEAVILLDCITLWLSNLLLDTALNDPEWETIILEKVRQMILLAREIRPQVLLVTNEVGQGIVPESPLARAFRDLAGRSNQILAAHADHVYLVVAGLPIDLKQAGTVLLADSPE